MTANRARARTHADAFDEAVRDYATAIRQAEQKRRETVEKARAIYKRIAQEAWVRFKVERDEATRRLRERKAAGFVSPSDASDLPLSWHELEEGLP
jgi:hypothetical protein